MKIITLMEEQEIDPFAGNIEKENLEWMRKREGCAESESLMPHSYN